MHKISGEYLKLHQNPSDSKNKEKPKEESKKDKKEQPK